MTEIYKKLRFDDETCALFKYLKTYHELLDNWLLEHHSTEENLKRYILISFWTEYRTANHHGDNFTIEPISEEAYIKRKQELRGITDEIKKKYPNIKIEKSKNEFNIGLDRNFIEMKMRRDYYFDYFINSITSTDEYLNIIGITSQIEDLAKYLYEYVVSGTKAPSPNTVLTFAP